MQTCVVPGCSRAVSRWGGHCHAHKTRKRRHGHPQQRGVTKAELGQYVRIIRDCKERNRDSPLWPAIEARWQSAVGYSERVVATYLDGKPMNRHLRGACQEIAQVAANVEPWVVVETALAMYLMQEQEPRRFVSDEAFWHQLARRVRGLTEVNAGTWYDHDSGKLKRVYRDLPAPTSLEIGHMLAETFGGAGLMIARRLAEGADQRRNECRVISQAITELETPVGPSCSTMDR